MMTGKIRNTLQALTPLADDHQGVLRLLNTAMLATESTRFATLVLASVSHRDGAVLLRLTCAGHPPPLIVRDGGHVEQADTKGTWWARSPDHAADVRDVPCSRRDVCAVHRWSHRSAGRSAGP